MLNGFASYARDIFPSAMLRQPSVIPHTTHGSLCGTESIEDISYILLSLNKKRHKTPISDDAPAIIHKIRNAFLSSLRKLFRKFSRLLLIY